MLQNALRRAKVSPATSRPSPFVCLFCSKNPFLTRSLSATVPSWKARKRNAAAPETDSETALGSQNLLNEIRKDIKDTVTRRKEDKETKQHKKVEPPNAAVQVNSKRRKQKSKGKEAKGKRVKMERKEKKPQSIIVRRVSGEDKSAPGVEGMSLAAALGKRPRSENMLQLDPDGVSIEPIELPDSEKPPALYHDLDRVLFNPGVHYLQDPRSRVYNFDPYLRDIMPVTEFDFNAVDTYITSSRDTKLADIAASLNKKYVGSTSSMTSVLSHFHYLLSHWRNINAESLSKSFPVNYRNFTQLSRAPAAVFLRYKENGTYAIDADKEFDTDSILSLLGRSLEKMLTLSPDSYEGLRKSANPAPIAHAADKFHYSTLGDFLMRSQLDAYDPRLPGTGMFDLKTRAVVSVRMDVGNFHLGSGYQIKTLRGQWESFEREYFDMIRAAFLKYSLQVRMGRMDGIFVAFHNTERIFGFQYVSLDEMDASIHEGWGSGLGDREFKLSLMLLNEMLNKATEKFPKQSLRFHFESRETQTPHMYIIAEPVSETDIEEIQRRNERDLDGFLKSLETKRDSVQRKAEFKGIAEKFGEVEEEVVEEETVVEVEDEGEVAAESGEVEPEVESAEAESTPAETAESSEAEIFEKTEGEKEVEAAPAAGGDGNGQDIEPTGNAAMIDETGTDDQDNDQTAQDDAEEDEDEEEDEEDEEEEDEDEDDEEETEELEESQIPDEHTEKPIPDFDSPVSLSPSDLPESNKPILAMTLTTYNLVNGRSVLRPNHLSAKDKWTVEYTVAEAKTPDRAWATYNAVKTRRRKAVENTGLSEDSDEVNQYVKYLRTLSKAGRTWAAEQETMFGDAEPIVYKGGLNGREETKMEKEEVKEE